MNKKNAGQKQLSQSEVQLIEQLRRHPQMRERVQSILDIAYSEAGPLKTADQIEELLIQEMRLLGNTSMHQLELTGRILDDVGPIHLACCSTIKLAPETGLEPVTRRLTAGCSTIELLWMPEEAKSTGPAAFPSNGF